MVNWAKGARVALVTAIVACTSVLAIAGSAGAASSKPVKGGSVTLMGFEPPSFNPGPWGTLSATGQIGFPVYDVLAYEDHDDAHVIPHMVKSITGSTDAMTWTFKMRPNVKFTDGTVFDAAALKANFDYHANPASRSQGFTLASSIASWDVSDPMVAKATLKSPNAAFDHLLVTNLSEMVSPTALQKYGADYGTSVDKVVGAGPFILKEWARGSQVVFERNPNYWDAPKPYLDKVTIRFVTDINAAYQTVLTGGADAFQTPSKEIEDQAKAAGLRLEPYRYNVVSFRSVYFMNVSRAPFNDLTARQAVQIALDPKKIAAARGLPVADSVYDHDSPYYDKSGTLPKYDPKKAQDLINQWSAKNGNKPLEFTITDIAGNTTLGGGAEVIQASLASYQNIKVNVRVIPAAQLAAIGTTGDFDLYPSALGGSDPTIPLNSALMTGGGRNFMKYSNPEMDAALTQGMSTTSVKGRQEAYKKAARIMVTDLPEWILPVQQYSAGNNWIVSNKQMTWDGGSWTGPLVSDIWLKKKA